jgi:hypothetical protein
MEVIFQQKNIQGNTAEYDIARRINLKTTDIFILKTDDSFFLM